MPPLENFLSEIEVRWHFLTREVLALGPSKYYSDIMLLLIIKLPF